MKANGRPSRREIEIGIARTAGYHHDTARFVRALVERKTASRAALELAFRLGEQLKAAGVPCNCRECGEARNHRLVEMIRGLRP